MAGDLSQELILQELVNVFPIRPMPRKADLIPVVDYRDDERDEIAAFLDGKRWIDLNRAVLRQYKGDTRAILPLLSDLGVKYYFPAFLRVGLTDYLECAGEFTSALHQFIQTSSPQIEIWKQRQMEQFSTTQLVAIRHAFEFVQRTYSYEYDPYEASDIDMAVERLSDMIDGKAVG